MVETIQNQAQENLMSALKAKEFNDFRNDLHELILALLKKDNELIYSKLVYLLSIWS